MDLQLPVAVFRSGDIVPVSLAAGGLPPEFDCLTVDVEHSGYPLGHEYYFLKTVQLGNPEVCLVLDASLDEHISFAVDALSGATLLCAHSAQADLIPLAERAGLGRARTDAWFGKLLDTMALLALIDPGLRPRKGHRSVLGLKENCLHFLGDHSVAPAADAERKRLFAANKWLGNPLVTTPPERNGWTQVDIADPVMVRYAASDVLDTAALLQHLLPLIEVGRPPAVEHAPSPAELRPNAPYTY